MGDCCNKTSNGWNFLCVPTNFQPLFSVMCTILILSIFLNIFCCASKCCSGKGICQSRARRRRSQRHMEDNPIYGNISHTQNMALFTTVDPPHSSLSSSSLGVNQQRVNSDSQSKTQDCYANLTLKAPRLHSGRSSPQIHYSDVVQLEELPSEAEKEDEGNTDAVSTMSDLYASVQTQRAITVDIADCGEGYANHL